MICGGLWSFVMVCGGLSYSHTAGGGGGYRGTSTSAAVDVAAQ